MPAKSFEFGEFQLDCERFELRRAGHTVKLEKKPMELLILLATRDGHLVTRSEIAESLWDRKVFVDTEHGINTAIRKIRRVLHDDPEQPRFVQTVPCKGYRFIATPVDSPASSPDADPASPPLPPPGLSGPTPQARKRLLLPTLATLAAALLLGVALVPRAGTIRLLHPAAKPPIGSLAVLPLDNLSGDTGQDYFADGMTDELITMLAKSSTLRIVSRTSVMQYKGVHRPLPEIARELNVDGILEGSISRAGNKVHLTIQLIQARGDTHLWAESYDRETADAVSLPREAAQAIAKRLNTAVPPLSPVRFVSPQAHDAYLRGRALWYTDHTSKAGPYFKQATELQPDYALGWAGLATYYGASAVKRELNPLDAIEHSKVAATTAVELDDSLPEAHLAMSGAAMLQWDLAKADREAQRAIELDPRFAEAYHLRSKILAALNRHDEAIEVQKKGTELDPFTRPWALALAYSVARRKDDAVADAQQRLDANPKNPILYDLLAHVYQDKGMAEEAEAAEEKALALRDDTALAKAMHRAFERGGAKGVLDLRLQRLRSASSQRYVSPLNFAEIYAAMGHREQTLAALKEAQREHSPGLLWMQSNPDFDFLHTDDRYRAIVRQVGLPPAF